MVCIPFAERFAESKSSSIIFFINASISSPLLAIRKSLPELNNLSSSFHSADISGMPQAKASNGRMVGIPGSIST